MFPLLFWRLRGKKAKLVEATLISDARTLATTNRSRISIRLGQAVSTCSGAHAVGSQILFVKMAWLVPCLSNRRDAGTSDNCQPISMSADNYQRISLPASKYNDKKKLRDIGSSEELTVHASNSSVSRKKSTAVASRPHTHIPRPAAVLFVCFLTAPLTDIHIIMTMSLIQLQQTTLVLLRCGSFRLQMNVWSVQVKL